MIGVRGPVIDVGTPYPLGATWDGKGVNFALFSDHAEKVELCLFDQRGRRELFRLPLPSYTDGVWHGYVPDARPGLRYGYRVSGPYEPGAGHRFNPYKLLLESVYANASDPWSFASSAYEAEKYATSLAVLDRARYAGALEIGCSIGVFTAQLAERCDALLAVDISGLALARARARNAGNATIRFERRRLPAEFPPGAFDLVTLAEVGYYWDDADAVAARERIAAALRPRASLLLVHFLPKVDDYLRSGDDVHEAYLKDARFALVHAARRERYRIDLLRRNE